MHKKMKKTLSMLLSVMMVLGLFLAMPLTASAAEPPAAPTISNVGIDNLTDKGANISFSSTQNGSYYSATYTGAGPTEPMTAADVVAASGAPGTIYGGIFEVNLIFLSEKTQYTAYIVAENAAGVFSNVVAVTFTTKATNPVPATVTPASARFDKNPLNPDYKDIVVTLVEGDDSWDGRIGLQGGGSLVDDGSLYTYTPGTGSYTITIKKEYLETLPIGPVMFTFTVVGGIGPSLEIHIAENPTIYPINKNFGDWMGSGDAIGEIDAIADKFIELLLRTGEGGAVPVDPSNFTVKDGSTIITLRESYLKTLPVGTYNFVANFTDGYADLTLNVRSQGGASNPTSSATSGNPKTGDDMPVGLLIALMAMAGAGAGFVIRRRFVKN